MIRFVAFFILFVFETLAYADVTPLLRVKETDGNPSVNAVNEITVSNGTLTNNGGGKISITTGGGGGGAYTDEEAQDATANLIQNNTYISWSYNDGLNTLTPTISGLEPTVTKGNLTESTSSVLTIGNGTNSVIGSGTTIQVKLAGAAQSGYISSTDWNTFNNKQDALTTGDLTANAPLSTSATRHVIGGAASISIAQATTSTSGYLSSADWNTFNGKQSSLGNINGIVYGDGAGNYSSTIGANTSWNSKKITNLADPTANQDAVTKYYVDTTVSGISWQEPAIDKDLTAPQGGPITGDRYIVASPATGAWSGQENKIAEYNGISWDFTAPSVSWALFINDENKGYVWNGSAWVIFSGSESNHAALANLSYATAGHTGFEPTVAKGNLTEATSSVLTITGGTGVVIGSGTSIQVKQASTSQSGYLSDTDWDTFNDKSTQAQVLKIAALRA